MLSFRPAPASLPDGERIYVIGDVHGCAKLLIRMHALIAGDLAARPIRTATVLHIGDYIDRGPDSAGVLEFLARGGGVSGVRLVNLLGNHEEMCLGALESPEREPALLWLTNGGMATLESWDVPYGTRISDWGEFVPAKHVEFLRRLEFTHQAGGYVFAHAGLRPGVPLIQQTRHDLLWIREPFLSWPGDFGAVVVHGHTPIQEPAVRPNRIGIDTGAVYGGRLTCAVLEEDRVGFFTV